MKFYNFHKKPGNTLPEYDFRTHCSSGKLKYIGYARNNTSGFCHLNFDASRSIGRPQY